MTKCAANKANLGRKGEKRHIKKSENINIEWQKGWLLGEWQKKQIKKGRITKRTNDKKDELN